VGTAHWTGVPLRYVLERCRLKCEAKFVCFEGADALPEGHYGTR
jgi:nitrate reductase (NAD(P)H)